MVRMLVCAGASVYVCACVRACVRVCVCVCLALKVDVIEPENVLFSARKFYRLGQ